MKQVAIHRIAVDIPFSTPILIYAERVPSVEGYHLVDTITVTVPDEPTPEQLSAIVAAGKIATRDAEIARHQAAIDALQQESAA